jgi:cytochrome c-type biogenesis protein CcmH/NrfG
MGRRNVSNVPAQSLVLMNDPFVVEQAALWAKNLPPTSAPQDRLRHMYAAAFARQPSPQETEDALAFLQEQATALNCPPGDARPWADLAHVLFNAKEFIHIN